MQNVTKKSGKTIEEYRHNIKLLKYNLKKEQKVNETLRYKESKKHKKEVAFKDVKTKPKDQIYNMLDTVNELSHRLKEMGLSLGDIFRMADFSYLGEITKEQFMKTIMRLKSNLEEGLINEMFYAIDTNLNGMLSTDEYQQFLYAHGGSDSKEAYAFQKSSAEVFAALLKKKSMKAEDFISKMLDPSKSYDIAQQLKKMGLNVNQTMILLKMWDPSLTGEVRHEVYLRSMDNVKQKDEKQIQNQKFQKGIKQLCVIFRDRRINPLEVFQQSESDGQSGISILELQDGLKKILVDQTAFQIKKWVNLINLNGDSEITKQEFVSAIRSFYSLQQINKFSTDYQKLHPKLKKALAEEEVPAQKIINDLSIAIEDSGLTKTEVFSRIDINGNGLIDKNELVEGLKNLGLKIGFIGKVLTVFDRDASGEVGLDQWLHILGEDVSVEDIGLPSDAEQEESPKKVQAKSIKKQSKKQTKTAKDTKQVKKQPETKSQVKKSVSKTKVEVSKQKEKPVSKPPINESKNKTQPLKPTNKVTQTSMKQSTGMKASSKKNEPKPIQKKESKKFAQDLKESVVELKQVVSDEEYDQPVDVEQLQKQVGQLYGKSKKKVLTIFQKNSKKRISISEKQLKNCFIQLKLKTDFTEQQIKAIFEANVSSNGLLVNAEWLESLLQKYNIQATIEKEQVEKPPAQQVKKNNSPDLPNLKGNEFISKIKEQVPDNQEDGQEQNQIIVKKGQKRGENNENFKQLLNLIVEDKKHTDEGYKLSSLINAQEELKLLNNQYLNTARSLKKNKKYFQDKNFPRNLSSLSDKDPSESNIENVTLIKWKHYRQIFKNPQLFENSIEPNDIKQGTLGDCYFLCSLASLAEYKKLIERLFQYYDLDSGYFLIWLCIDGKWKLYQIDGYIPVDPTGKRVIFSHGLKEELWVMLLQKAYAKAYGSYQHIVGGQPYEAIKDLTGAPGQSFSHKKIESNDLWQKLLLANKQEFMMTCGTDKDQAGEAKLDGHSQSITTEGIVLGHAYSILDVVVYKKQRLIQLRNPWGETQWKGDWSDQSKKWTPQAKKTLNYNSLQNDGIFWMPFDAYFSHYSTTAINFIRPNYYYTSETRKKTKCLLIKIKSGSFKHGFVMFSQRDHRKDGLPPNTPYKMSHVIALTYKNGQVIRKVADQKYMYQREGSVEIGDIEEEAEAIVMINLEQEAEVQICTYADTKMEYQTDDKFDSLLVYMQGLAKMEEAAKNVQQMKDLFKSWMVAVGQVAFLVFKSISKKPYTLQLELKDPKNIKLFPQGAKRDIKMGVGCTQCVKGKIINMKQSYSFGGMSFVPK